MLMDLKIKGVWKSKKPAEFDFCGLLQILGANYADRTVSSNLTQTHLKPSNSSDIKEL
jgi:hypothetical protein